MVEDYKMKYGAAKTVGAIIAFVGWAVIVFGIVVVILCISAAPNNAQAFGGAGMLIMYAIAGLAFMISLIGLVLAGAGQLIRAAADNSNNTGAMLSLMRNHRPLVDSSSSREPNDERPLGRIWDGPK
jgi:hypothetical protein